MRISVHDITKRFGKNEVVGRSSFSIGEGELFTLLGPSGCGKTTLLRLIAGFYTPDEGEIRFDDVRVNDVPPHERGIGMVFQNYALWPHMTVFENIAYGLKLREVGRAEIERRVEGVLDKEGKLIPRLTVAEARARIADGTISGGMIPKIETAIEAVDAGVKAAVILDGRIPHVLLLELFTDHGAGTMITAE